MALTEGVPGRRRSGRVEETINRAVLSLAPHWIAVVSTVALLVVGGAAGTPWLAAHGHGLAAQLLYWLYRPLCPQRPSHSFFIAGRKMAFEQRETAMFLAVAAAGPLSLLLDRVGLRVPGWAVSVALTPMAFDVGTQMVGLRASDGFWRALTGALAVVPLVCWVYPRLTTGTTAAGTKQRDGSTHDGTPAAPVGNVDQRTGPGAT